jgi:DNA adenine methylase
VQLAVPDAWSPPDAKPFLKWVGGKRQILPELMRHVPAKFARYHEPFLGGGALFFHLRRQRSFPAFLTDSNARLIRTYRGIQHDVEGVIRLLTEHAQKHGRTFFHKVRDRRDVDSATMTDVAAWLIYLNRTAYNGLYRVNSHNIFNVPFGKYANPTICDVENLRACSAALKDAELDPLRFESVLDRARPGDFVYFDPPYRPVTITANFTTYTSDGFNDADQARLRDVALLLKKRGVHVLLSNSNAPLIEELYKGFEKFRVGARRSVNSDPTGRGLVQELIIK